MKSRLITQQAVEMTLNWQDAFRLVRFIDALKGCNPEHYLDEVLSNLKLQIQKQIEQMEEPQ